MSSSNLIRKSSKALSSLLADKFLLFLEGYVKIWTVFCRLWGATFAGPASLGTIFREMAKQIYFTSVRGVYILIFVGLMLGMELILNTQQLAQMVKVPLEDYLGSLLATVVVRELSPVIAVLFVLIHSSGAIVSEIGTMSVDGELEALQIMGIDPYRYLGVPRFWAMTISVICLNFLIMFCAVASGYLFSQIYTDISWYNFLHAFSNSLQLLDLGVSFIKAAIFGMVISTVAICAGFESSGDMGQVAKKTAEGALWSLWLCGFMDFLIISAYQLSLVLYSNS
jgi:phospholipid/cholesterol/gamma-HCH transport system permease protein